jgi:hypothetical protein
LNIKDQKKKQELITTRRCGESSVIESINLSGSVPADPEILKDLASMLQDPAEHRAAERKRASDGGAIREAEKLRNMAEAGTRSAD